VFKKAGVFSAAAIRKHKDGAARRTRSFDKRDDSLTTLHDEKRTVNYLSKSHPCENNTGDGAGGGFGKLCAQVSGKPRLDREKSILKEGLVHEVEAVPYKKYRREIINTKHLGCKSDFSL